MYSAGLSIYIFLVIVSDALVYSDKFNLGSLENYSHFLNFGEKKIKKLNEHGLENDFFISKVNVLGKIFKKNIQEIKTFQMLDIVFLIDASSSVGEHNFKSEIKFVRKVLSDVTVDYNHARVAVITFSSSNRITKHVDEISYPSNRHNKCNLLNKDLNQIKYKGGETYTLGAFQTAKDIFNASKRKNSKKVIFLITDGYSNGGDPTPIANFLKNNKTIIFTIGIQNGNYKELFDISSTPGYFYSYLLDSFNEFESLARRALHVDLKSGIYIPLQDTSPCNVLCGRKDCCDSKAACTCGITTGHYSCLCQPGYHGSGMKNACFPCDSTFYWDGPNVCLPCPDRHHFTEVPAIGISSCQCSAGYKRNELNGCLEIKCPNFIIPENGYITTGNFCSNSINSTCEVRCQIGYTLSGSGKRTCLKDGTWSGSEPLCKGQICKNLYAPKDGWIECVNSENKTTFNNVDEMPVDTICYFKCGKGKILIGSQKRTCLPSGHWDGLKTFCKHIKCSKLSDIKFGKIEPPSCLNGKQEVGKVCNIKCEEGFKVRGNKEITCIGGYGTWNSKFEESICIDVTPPNLICPKDIVNNTLPGKIFGQVNWVEPNVTDNSGLSTTVWVKPAIKNITNFKFAIGRTQVTYYAQDAFQNRAKCSFNVIIKDGEPPVIEGCVNPPSFLVSDGDGDYITWDEPYIYDNSQKVKIEKSHQFGFFPVGKSFVEYTATDSSNNTNICRINITVELSRCKFLPSPAHGDSECLDNNNRIQCLITCDEGYAIPISQTDGGDDNFICNHADPFWFSEDDNLYPDCTVTKIPTEFIENGVVSVTVNNEDCSDSSKMKMLENYTKESFGNEICIDHCIMESEITECKLEKAEEDSNKINKRDTVNYEEVPHKNKSKKQKGRLNIKYQVRGKYLNDLGNENVKLKLTNNYNVTVRRYRRKFVCPHGFVPRKSRCVQCPKGTFHNITRIRCQSCDFGHYNDKLGQTKCNSCPPKFSTKKLHSKKLDDCRSQCPPGTHARKKLLKYSKKKSNVTLERITLAPHCRSCAVGLYQPEYGQLTCIECPKGYTTLLVGSVNQSSCIATAEEMCKRKVCHNSSCISNNLFQYTCNCNDNYIGTHCEKMVNYCESEPCYNDGTCLPNKSGFVCFCKKGYHGKFCEERLRHCLKNCLNNGTCIVDDNNYSCICPSGYNGEYCEERISYCDKNVCENNSICREGDGIFICQCTAGYVGRRCNLLPCDYRPCHPYEMCINTIDAITKEGNFRCTCSEGFMGVNCTVKINMCSSAPCQNHGICISQLNTYICSCSSLYYGTHCEHKRNTNYVLSFQSYDTSNYIRLKGFHKNLIEISACLWMHTLDNFNYGTLFSYASRTKDNAFTLTDYTGLVLYINNNRIVTDISLNDGLWHHVCVTWNSSGGTYEIYIDGKLVMNGVDLSPNTTIEGNGQMIIGQEQDAFGGRFSQSESYVGKMSYIDVWSHVVTYKDIQTHFNDCNETFFGDLYAWPEFQDYVGGRVEVMNSTFCTKCEDPFPLFSGYINVVDNVAYYSCYEGFQLNNMNYVKGRKCTKASKWEGTYEPYCKRIYCGYPGFIRNGYPLGNKYYYNDKIIFYCYEGYKLEGNNTITCGENSQWYPEKPKCTGVQCTAFKKPEHSELDIHSDQSYEDYKENVTKFEIGTQIEITCDLKSNMTSESILTCLENGLWDFDPPECITNEAKLACPIDKLPLAPNNSFINEDSLYEFGNATSDIIAYNCERGYLLKGSNTTTCIIDGYWTVPNFTCEAITCGKPQLPRNALVTAELKTRNTYSYDDTVSFKCEEGFNSFGNGVIRCLQHGKWSRMQGKCIKKSCRKPNVQGNTSIQGKSYLYADKVIITCPSGSKYELVCNKHGIWEGQKDNSC